MASAPGKGSIFTVRLPIFQEKAPNETNTNCFWSMTSWQTCRSCSAPLSDQYRVHLAQSGEEALQMLEGTSDRRRHHRSENAEHDRHGIPGSLAQGVSRTWSGSF